MLELTEALRPAVLKPAEADDYLCVIMPMAAQYRPHGQKEFINHPPPPQGSPHEAGEAKLRACLNPHPQGEPEEEDVPLARVFVRLEIRCG